MAPENLPRISSWFKRAAFGRSSLRGWAAVLVALWLTQMIGNTTWGREFDYINADTGARLQSFGHMIEAAQELIAAAKELDESVPSAADKAVKMIIDLESRQFSTSALQPANNAQNASGSGLNINNDGTCIVGYQDSGFSTVFHAFRWTAATKAVDLGTLDPPNNASNSSFAFDTNQDCSVVVGYSSLTQGNEHAFRWTSGGMVDLGVPAGGGSHSRAYGVSSDGTVIVGEADFPDVSIGMRKGAFRWTGGAFTDLVPGNRNSLATAVSGDGTVVVGATVGAGAFRWTQQNPTAQPIDPLPGHTTAAATAVSDNGKIVVGMSSSGFLDYRGPVLG